MDEIKKIEPVKKDAHLDAAEELQGLWLAWMKRAMEDGTATSTDMATLARVLLANGWSLDPMKLPKNLRDKLTEKLDLNDPATAQELGIALVR